MKKNIRSTQIVWTPGSLDEIRQAIGVTLDNEDSEGFRVEDFQEDDGEVVDDTPVEGSDLESPWPIELAYQEIIHGDSSQLTVDVTLQFDYADESITDFEVRVTAL